MIWSTGGTSVPPVFWLAHLPSIAVPIVDESQRNFLRSLLHQMLQSSLNSVMWRLPTALLVLLIAGLIAVIWYYQLY